MFSNTWYDFRLDLVGKRRRFFQVTVTSFFLYMSKVGRLLPRARASRRGVELLRDISYHPDNCRAHLLDIYRPTTPPPGAGWPVVLYVHGGGFSSLSKDTHWIMGLAFARHGFLVCNINYHLAPRFPFPAAIADTCTAYRWVVDHISEFGGDAEKIVLAGESAGANLVTALALTTCYERDEEWARTAWEARTTPKVVLAACGLFQTTEIGRLFERKHLPLWVRDHLILSARDYVGRRGASKETELADPVRVLEQGATPARPLPAFFLPVGTKDPLLADTRRLESALRMLDVPCQAAFYPGEIHAFHALVFRKQARQCWRDMFDFTDRCLEPDE